MPIVKDIEISVRQKKLMYADMLFELELCETEEEVKKLEEDFEHEIEQMTGRKTDEYWTQVINEQIETTKQLIKLKGELDYASSYFK